MEEVEMQPINGVQHLALEPAERERASAWKRWRKVAAIGLGLIVVALLMITNVIPIRANQDSAFQNKADYYLKSLDRNLQPCEDFYTFACGNLRNVYRQENKSHFDTMAMMTKNVRLFLDDLFTKPSTTSDSATLRQMKNFHQMCIDKTKAETEGIEPVLTMLNEIGGWPLLTNDSENSESWEQIVGSVNRAGFATFFPYHLQPGTRISLSPLLDSTRPRVLPIERRTINYVKLVASLLNATNDRIEDDIVECINFETKLLELPNSIVEGYQNYTLESLNTNYPKIAWKTFFGNVFISTGIEVSSNEPVGFSHPWYNIKVSELLNQTSAKTIRNYVVWRLIVEAIPLMPEKFREAKNAFEQQMVGRSRNLDCVETLISKANVSVGYVYIENYFDQLVKNKSHAMVKSIEAQAYRFLININWMDYDSKRKIIETMKKSKIVLPHSNVSTDLMEAVEFRSNDTIFANYRRLAEAHRNFEFRRVRMSKESDRQIIPFLYAVNAEAYFAPDYNEVYILAAIFQPPVFSVEPPMYLNYGGIGFRIAHEMTHAMRLLSVCENKTCPSFDHFQERKNCTEKLYGGYVLKQLKEAGDGKRTLEENIGDLIGLKLSYRAYEEFAKDAEEQLLPGLDYTARQWFWINAATTFCSYRSDDALREYVTTEEYSPAEVRVNVAFANTEEFSRDFNCPIGSRMNPSRKCECQ